MTAPRGSLREILAPIRAASGSGGAAERSPTRERNRGQRRTASEILEEMQAAANRPKIRTPGADQMRTSSGADARAVRITDRETKAAAAGDPAAPNTGTP